MAILTINDIEEALKQFKFEGELVGYKRIIAGHINDTLDVLFKDGDHYHRYILQRVNTYVYKKPEEVMINMDRITTHIANKVRLRGGDPTREVLNLIHTLDDKPYYIDSNKGFWRVMRFIDGEAYNGTPDHHTFKQGAIAFGRFQHDLADFPVSKLYETIIDFHNTPNRYLAFEKVVKEDKCDRVKEAGELIELTRKYSYLKDVYNPYIKDGSLPLRATHNDTKLNNVMLDKKTGNPICVLDLDTCMPGYSVNDFGDAIRSGCSTASKTEQDRSKIHINLDLYKSYVEGFLQETKDTLSDSEIHLLATSCMVMAYELGMRYLTDYLEGDPYFQGTGNTSLLKARNQLYYMMDMIEHKEEMEKIVENVLTK